MRRRQVEPTFSNSCTRLAGARYRTVAGIYTVSRLGSVALDRQWPWARWAANLGRIHRKSHSGRGIRSRLPLSRPITLSASSNRTQLARLCQRDHRGKVSLAVCARLPSTTPSGVQRVGRRRCTRVTTLSTRVAGLVPTRYGSFLQARMHAR